MYKGENIDHICKECGTPFSGHPHARYCSDKCRKAVNARNNAKNRKLNNERARQELLSFTKGGRKKKPTLAEVAKAASNEGMTYGEFVAAGCPGL